MIKFGVILIAWEIIDPKLRERWMAPEVTCDEVNAMCDATFKQMSEHRRKDALLGWAMTVASMLLYSIAILEFTSFINLDSVLK